MKFTDPFDEELAKKGPGAVFIRTYEGELQLEILKSRDLRRQHEQAGIHDFSEIDWRHCVLIDAKTQWPHYALISSPNLCKIHQRGRIIVCESYEEALTFLEEEKNRFYQRNS